MKAYCTSVALAIATVLAAGSAGGEAKLGWDPITGSPMVTTTGANLVVPYRVMAGTAPLDRVELLVSTDRGLSWKVSGSSPGAVGRITYVAPRPGVYWFITRARDRLGNAEHKPREGMRPELVYTVVPQAAPPLAPARPEAPVALTPSPAPAPAPVEPQMSWAPPADPELPVIMPATREAPDPAGAEDAGPHEPSPSPEAPEAGMDPPASPLLLQQACDLQAAPPAETEAETPAGEREPDHEPEDPYASDPSDPATKAPRLHLVRGRTCGISYNIPGAEAIGLSAVDLYFTRDKGFTWTRYGEDADRKSPAVFAAPSEGVFGFYLTFRLLDGTGNKPPQTGTAPQKWVLVDYTPPLLQILTPKDAQVIRRRQPVRITWAAFDARPVERPISIRYRRPDETDWTPIAPAIEDAGEFAWQPPETLSGRVVLSVAALDKTSNRTSREVTLRLEGETPLPETRPAGDDRATVEPEPGPAAVPPPATDHVAAPPAVPAPLPPVRPAVERMPAAAPVAPTVPSTPAPSPPAAEPAPPPVRVVAPAATAGPQTPRQRALAAYHRATLLRARQKLAEAEAAFREVIHLDPAFADAYNDLACLLLPQGRSKEAIAAFQRALHLVPNNTNALYGLAMAQLQGRQLTGAAETLSKLVALKPTDAEGWLYLGDVMYYQQKLPDARRCWQKARRYAAQPRVSAAATGRLQQFR